MFRFVIVLILFYFVVKAVFPFAKGTNPRQMDESVLWQTSSGEQVDSVSQKSLFKPLFSVSPLQGVNSNRNDFCPVVYNNKLVFVSERESDFLNIGEDRSKRQLNLTIQYSDIIAAGIDSVKFFLAKIFSEPISTILYHSGPITFSGDGNNAILTGVEFYKDKEDSLFRPRLYAISKNKNGWTKPILINVNKKGFSMSHPGLSQDGNYLYFVSDMPGGYGGQDIYMCKRTGDFSSWSEPVNPGPEINNKGNQVFPYIHSDGTLYFSSDGHKVMGGLDLFSAKNINGKWTKVTNLGSSINSPSDDFGIYFNAGNNSGYFSTNRSRGIGLPSGALTKIGDDNIWSFSVQWLPPPQPAQLYLISQKGDTLMVAVRNEEGYFSFRKLPLDKNYSFYLKGDSTIAEEELKLMLVDLSEKILFTTAMRDTGNFFHYEYLSGQKIKLYLVNKKGDTLFISTRTRDEFFAFSKLPFNEAYTFLLDERIQDPSQEIKLVIHDNEGNRIFTTALQDKSNKLKYRFLPEEKIRLYMVSENGDTIAISTKDRNGYFLFRKLPGEANFIALLDENDTLSAEIKLIEYDERGRGKLIVLQRGKDGYFRFIRLPYKEAKLYLLSLQGDTLMIGFPDKEGKFIFEKLPSTSNCLLTLSGADPALLHNAIIVFKSGDVEVTSKVTKDEKGNFTLEKLPFSEAKLYVISAKGDTLLVAHRDAKGNFVFEKLPNTPNYLFAFSEVDPALVNDANIIFKKKDGGEIAMQVEKDKKGEFRHQKLPFSESKLYLLSETGDTLMVAIMNQQGKFVFEKLPPNPHYVFSFSGDDPQLMKDADIIFRKPSGEEIDVTAVKGEDGMFHHEKLPFSEAKLYLLSLSGDTLMVARQDENGNFIFDKLPSGQFYIFALEAADPDVFKNAEIIFYARGGEKMKITALRGKDGLFRQENLPLSEAKLYLISEKGDTLGVARPNAQGIFVFEKLPDGIKYFFAADPRAVQLAKELTIMYYDAGGKTATANIIRDPRHIFRYNYLPSVITSATAQHVTEPQLDKTDIKPAGTDIKKEIPLSAACSEGKAVCIYFKYQSAIVPPQYYEDIKGIAIKLKENPALKAKVFGFTDNIGSSAENMGLSRKRVYNVGRKLIQAGVPPSRIKTNYYGEKKPAAPNDNPDGSDNPDGRQKNRRVELVVE